MEWQRKLFFHIFHTSNTSSTGVLKSFKIVSEENSDLILYVYHRILYGTFIIIIF